MHSIESFARNYKNGLRLSRLDTIVMVEDKASKEFWTFVFDKYAPKLKIKVIVKPKIVDKDGEVKKQSNVHAVLKYLPFADCQLILCKDSDYDYLFQDPALNNQSFLFQTYTYSVENYLCYGPSLKDVSERTTLEKDTQFDFDGFLKEYSSIVYELFLRSYEDELERSKLFEVISLPGIIDLFNPENALIELKSKVDFEIIRLKKKYPAFDFEACKKTLFELGLTPENTYLFLRGHNVFDSVVKHLLHSVSREYRRTQIELITEEFDGFDIKIKVDNYLGETLTVEEALNANRDFDDCVLFDKIKKDIESFINQCAPNFENV